MPELEDAINKIQEYASLQSKYSPLPFCEFDFTSSENGFRGNIVVEMKYPITKSKLGGAIKVIQEGVSPFGRITFEDLIRMDCYYADLGEETAPDLSRHTNQKIQRIQGYFCNSTLHPTPRFIERVTFYSDNSTCMHFEGINNNPHFYTIRKGYGKKSSGKIIGNGSINAREGEDKFFDFIFSLCNKFQATETKFEKHQKVIPFSYMEPQFNLNDFIFYLLLAEDSNLNLVNQAQSLVSTAQLFSEEDELVGRTDLLIENISKEGSQLIEPFILSTEMINGKINPANKAYQLLISEETQKVIQFLNTFMQENKNKYDALLNTLEAKIEQEQQAALQK